LKNPETPNEQQYAPDTAVNPALELLRLAEKTKDAFKPRRQQLCEAVCAADEVFIRSMAELIESLPKGTVVSWDVDVKGKKQRREGKVIKQNDWYANWTKEEDAEWTSRRVMVEVESESSDYTKYHWVTLEQLRPYLMGEMDESRS
jgi:hypothetical protein